MRRAVAALALSGAAALTIAAGGAKEPSLPRLGTALSELPEGPGASPAQAACLQCHSADMLRQQRLTTKQWTAEVDKMTRWGAAVKETDRDALIAYLAARFGPDNTFTPIAAAPLDPGAPKKKK